MICDAHVHVGYFNRRGYDAPFYYSPRRICSVLKRCGVWEFIFSSTSMQTVGVRFSDVHREAREVCRLFGRGAHPFLWITIDYLKYDPNLSVLHEGFYEGVKLHGQETPWLTVYEKELESILTTAEEQEMPVMLHTGLGNEARSLGYLPHILRHASVKFNLAHGKPTDDVVRCLQTADQTFVDVSCMGEEGIDRVIRAGYADRLLWGTDFPVLSARSGEPLTQGMRRSLAWRMRVLPSIRLDDNFARFLGMPIEKQGAASAMQNAAPCRGTRSSGYFE